MKQNWDLKLLSHKGKLQWLHHDEYTDTGSKKKDLLYFLNK